MRNRVLEFAPTCTLDECVERMQHTGIGYVVSQIMGMAMVKTVGASLFYDNRGVYQGWE